MIFGVLKTSYACNPVQNRAMRYYMGVHRFAPIVGMRDDFGWSCTVTFRGIQVPREHFIHYYPPCASGP